MNKPLQIIARFPSHDGDRAPNGDSIFTVLSENHSGHWFYGFLSLARNKLPKSGAVHRRPRTNNFFNLNFRD